MTGSEINSSRNMGPRGERSPLIALFTDFGIGSPYVAEIQARIWRESPDARMVSLISDAPAFDPQLGSYLLAAHAPYFPDDAVFLCVVDPGVGSERRALAVQIGKRWFVGPDNGLFEMVIRQASDPVAAYEIAWTPGRLSSSFHGRDLFAPVAAWLSQGIAVPGGAIALSAVRREKWPDDLARVIYVDAYGNVITAVRGASLPADAVLVVGNHRLKRAVTFSDVSPGTGFWYVNSSEMVELAVNSGNAAKEFSLRVGDPVTMTSIREA